MARLVVRITTLSWLPHAAVARIIASLTPIEEAAMAGQPTVERITFLIAAAHISRLDLEEWPAASPHRGLAPI